MGKLKGLKINALWQKKISAKTFFSRGYQALIFWQWVKSLGRLLNKNTKFLKVWHYFSAIKKQEIAFFTDCEWFLKKNFSKNCLVPPLCFSWENLCLVPPWKKNIFGLQKNFYIVFVFVYFILYMLNNNFYKIFAI